MGLLDNVAEFEALYRQAFGGLSMQLGAAPQSTDQCATKAADQCASSAAELGNNTEMGRLMSGLRRQLEALSAPRSLAIPWGEWSNIFATFKSLQTQISHQLAENNILRGRINDLERTNRDLVNRRSMMTGPLQVQAVELIHSPLRRAVKCTLMPLKPLDGEIPTVITLGEAVSKRIPFGSTINICIEVIA